MPARRNRSRSYKRQEVRTPGGRTHSIYADKKKAPAVCANCCRKLGGVPRLASGGMGVIHRSSRMPNRMYGGYFCVTCSRRLLKQKARS